MVKPSVVRSLGRQWPPIELIRMCGLLLPFGSLPAGCAVGPGLMQRPELIPARLLAALVTPEFHRGEGFSRLFLDSPWPSGRLLTSPATIPAIPQVLHLPISLGIHLHRPAISEVETSARRIYCLVTGWRVTGIHVPARLQADTASPYTSLPKERIGPIFVWLMCKERVDQFSEFQTERSSRSF